MKNVLVICVGLFWRAAKEEAEKGNAMNKNKVDFEPYRATPECKRATPRACRLTVLIRGQE